jgi:hypothetical protein
LTVAIAVSPLLQLTVVVIFRVLPSLYVPVAVNGWFVPKAKDELAGVTATDIKTGCATVSVAVAVMEPEAAIIDAVPTLTPVARPPPATVATAVEDDVQVTLLLTFCVLPLL